MEGIPRIRNSLVPFAVLSVGTRSDTVFSACCAVIGTCTDTPSSLKWPQTGTLAGSPGARRERIRRNPGPCQTATLQPREGGVLVALADACGSRDGQRQPPPAIAACADYSTNPAQRLPPSAAGHGVKRVSETEVPGFRQGQSTRSLPLVAIPNP